MVRSSAPARVPLRTPEERVQLIAFLRRLRTTAAEIAEVLVMPLPTVSAVLAQIGPSRPSRPTATSRRLSTIIVSLQHRSIVRLR